jgi:hypothetical protein
MLSPDAGPAVFSWHLPDPPADTWQAHEAECRRLEDGIKAPGAGGIERECKRYIAAGDACRRAFETVPNGPDAIGSALLLCLRGAPALPARPRRRQ